MSKLTYVGLMAIVCVVLAPAGCSSAGASSAQGASTSARVASSASRTKSSPRATARSSVGSDPSSAGPSKSDVQTLADSDHCLRGTTARFATLPRSLPLPLAVLGHSSKAVVFSNQSDEFACSWLPFARKLVKRGYEVLLYDVRSSFVGDLDAVAAYAQAHGAKSVTFVGASQGAKTALVAAGTKKNRPEALHGVVALSPEARLAGTDVAPYVRKVRVPTLLVTAKHDPYGSAWATKEFMKVAPKTARRMVVPGDQHGTALLTRKGVRAAVMAFLDAHAG